MGEPTTYQRIYRIVGRIPHGRVATYGQVAALAGLPGQARLAGYALHALPASTALPWHRVINAQGGISLRGPGGDVLAQRMLLESEGVAFDARGRVRLETCRWKPRRRALAPRDLNRGRGA
jgi:methylated-DNA-protein-cysteine methyltransferase-like protein